MNIYEKIVDIAKAEARAERRRRVANRKARRLKTRRLALMELIEKEAPRRETGGRKPECVSCLDTLPPIDERHKQKSRVADAERRIGKVVVKFTAWMREGGEP